MKSVSVDIAGIMHTNHYLDGIRCEGVGASKGMQASITFDTCHLTFCDPLAAFW
jgi:hypothetical protein